MYICIYFTMYPQLYSLSFMRFIQVLNNVPLFLLYSKILGDLVYAILPISLLHFYLICRKYVDELCIRLQLSLKLKSTRSIRKVQRIIYNVTHIIMTLIMHAYYLLCNFSDINPIHSTFCERAASVLNKPMQNRHGLVITIYKIKFLIPDESHSNISL